MPDFHEISIYARLFGRARSISAVIIANWFQTHCCAVGPSLGEQSTQEAYFVRIPEGIIFRFECWYKWTLLVSVQCAIAWYTRVSGFELGPHYTVIDCNVITLN